ncbi:hypothetical protein H0H81_007833, partial [Sphagnurus paluster]
MLTCRQSQQQAAEEPEEDDGWGPSIYNDGDGIQLTITFTPKIVPGAKKHRNAKPASFTKVIYIHEDYGIAEFPTPITQLFDCEDLLDTSWLYHQREYNEVDSFCLAYTIPRSGLNNVSFTMKTSKTDYAEMIKQACTKAKPNIKVFLTENEPSADDDDDNSSDDNKAAAVAKKKHK